MPVEHELAGILDRDQPLVPRDLPNERLGKRRLARSRGPRNQDVLARGHGEAHESAIVPGLEEFQERLLSVIWRLRGAARGAEYPALGELIERPHLVRGPADRDRDRPGRRRRRQHKLDALAARERRGQQWRFGVDPLPRGIRDELRETLAPRVASNRERYAVPSRECLDIGLA